MLLLAGHAAGCRGDRRQWPIIESLNPAAPFVASESCNRNATTPGIQVLCKIDKESFSDAFNEDVDLPAHPKRLRVSKLTSAGSPLSKTCRARDATSSSKQPALSEPTLLPSVQISIRAPGRR